MRAAVRHYRDVVGFEVMTMLPGAAFVAAGGYHHHVDVNTWRGEGIPPVRQGAVGMRRAVLHVGGEDVVRADAGARPRRGYGAVQPAPGGDGHLDADPSGNVLHVRP